MTLGSDAQPHRHDRLLAPLFAEGNLPFIPAGDVPILPSNAQVKLAPPEVDDNNLRDALAEDGGRRRGGACLGPPHDGAGGFVANWSIAATSP